MEDLLKNILAAAKEKGLKVATVESCTGGLIAKLLTDISGSSEVFERGFVTYSNEAKMELVGVPSSLLKQHGAVSEPVARVMAEGGITHSKADIVVSVTGIAGPTGGTKEKPVGLVYVAVSKRNGNTECVECHFKGSREEIRLKTAEKALELLVSHIKNHRLSA